MTPAPLPPPPIPASAAAVKAAAFRFGVFGRRQLQLMTWWMPGSPHATLDGVIAEGAIRSGKTIGAVLGFVLWTLIAFHWQGRAGSFIVAGKSMGALKRNVLDPLFKILRALGIPYAYNRSSEDPHIAIGPGLVRYYLFAGNNEASADTLQGFTASGALLDEATLHARVVRRPGLRTLLRARREGLDEPQPQGAVPLLQAQVRRPGEDEAPAAPPLHARRQPQPHRRAPFVLPAHVHRHLLPALHPRALGARRGPRLPDVLAQTPRHGAARTCRTASAPTRSPSTTARPTRPSSAPSATGARPTPRAADLDPLAPAVLLRLFHYAPDSATSRRRGGEDEEGRAQVNPDKTDAQLADDFDAFYARAIPSGIPRDEVPVVIDPSAKSFAVALSQRGYRVVKGRNDVDRRHPRDRLAARPRPARAPLRPPRRDGPDREGDGHVRVGQEGAGTRPRPAPQGRTTTRWTCCATSS